MHTHFVISEHGFNVGFVLAEGTMHCFNAVILFDVVLQFIFGVEVFVTVFAGYLHLIVWVVSMLSLKKKEATGENLVNVEKFYLTLM